jgi:aspartate carbamoyltransferase catalytic subunit
MKLNRKDILGIQELSVEEINLILETADSFIEVSFSMRPAPGQGPPSRSPPSA